MEQVQPQQPGAVQRPAVHPPAELARMTRGLRWVHQHSRATAPAPRFGEQRTQPPRAA